jgi:predicted DNA-binding transcriptional regulator AlpA
MSAMTEMQKLAKLAAPIADVELHSDLLWGVEAIAKFIGRERRQVYYLIARRAFPSRKIGHRTIVASKSELRTFLAAQAQS